MCNAVSVNSLTVYNFDAMFVFTCQNGLLFLVYVGRVVVVVSSFTLAGNVRL